MTQAQVLSYTPMNWESICGSIRDSVTNSAFYDMPWGSLRLTSSFPTFKPILVTPFFSSRSLFGPCLAPESGLARYRLLSSRAGVHVSPIQLGGMSIGDQWVELGGLGGMDKESSFELLNATLTMEATLSTQLMSSDRLRRSLNHCQLSWIVKIAFRRHSLGNGQNSATTVPCDQGFSISFYNVDDGSHHLYPFFISIHLTSMDVTNRCLLKRFYAVEIIRNLFFSLWDIPSRTCELTTSTCFIFISGIGILALKKSWVHYTTCSPRKGFVSGNVYWFLEEFFSVILGDYYREHPICRHGSSLKLTSTRSDHAHMPFIIYQGLWNIMDCSFEWEILPMAGLGMPLGWRFTIVVCLGIALAPWNVLAGGKFRTDAEEERQEKSADRGQDGFGGRDWKWKDDQQGSPKGCEEVGANHITYFGSLLVCWQFTLTILSQWLLRIWCRKPHSYFLL